MKTIPEIEELEDWREIRTNNFNQQVVYEFHNGFGASVILGKYSYGFEIYKPFYEEAQSKMLAVTEEQTVLF